MSKPKRNIVEDLQQESLRNLEAPRPSDSYINLPPFDVNAALEFLRYLREDDDADEQRETFAYLQRVLDEDRLSERKLFP